MHRNEMVARWRTLLSAIVRRGPRNLALGLLLPLLCTACASANAFAPTSVPAAQTPPAQPSAIPLLAYYYIWFDPGSWDRAKTDLPLLGAYSSDGRKVALQHIQWAKSAGINGFIVSWKSTPTLNHRLQLLIDIAKQEHFKLLVIYQGLDFDRNPLPVARVAADLDYFIATFASDPVFDLYERPVVIWSGTWKFSRDEIASVTAARRQKLLILASERNEEDYKRIADTVDGDAYYWSSVNPATFPNYQGKLDAMANAVHANRGLWIAPAAAGFDARLIGGTQVVERNDGATLRTELDAALRSSPDAVGVISWNEFSENSYIEPSRHYGQRYLDVLTQYHQGSTPQAANELDSSMPGSIEVRNETLVPLVILAVLIVASLAVLFWRSLHRQNSDTLAEEGDRTVYEYEEPEPHIP